MKWVMEIAPAFPPHLFSTLTGLAWHADTKGRGSYPSVARLAAYGCKAPRSVQRDLRELEELKMIRLGDQSLAEHIPADRRPPVYDLAVERVVDGGTRVPPWSASGRPKRTAERGAVDDTPSGVTPASPRKKNGVSSTTERGDAYGSNGATYTSPNPSFDPSGEPLSPDAPEADPPEPPAAPNGEREDSPLVDKLKGIHDATGDEVRTVLDQVGREGWAKSLSAWALSERGGIDFAERLAKIRAVPLVASVDPWQTCACERTFRAREPGPCRDCRAAAEAGPEPEGVEQKAAAVRQKADAIRQAMRRSAS